MTGLLPKWAVLRLLRSSRTPKTWFFPLVRVLARRGLVESVEIVQADQL